MTRLLLQVKQVILQNGDVLPADVVVVGIGKYNRFHFKINLSVFLILFVLLGVIPNSNFLKGSMVEVDSSNAIIVDKVRYLPYLQIQHMHIGDRGFVISMFALHLQVPCSTVG